MVHIFIINSHAGSKSFATDLRRQLLKVKEIEYYIFNVRQDGERALIKRIQSFFFNDKLRIYCCGGSGTICNVMNGLDEVGMLESVELAFYPCGMTNDFLKSFGEKAELFKDLGKLITGDAVPIDYIRTNHGVLLNTFSIGLDSEVLENLEEMRYISDYNVSIPYIIGLVKAIFKSKPCEYELIYDNEKIEGPISQAIFGNGCVVGGFIRFTETCDVKDGLADLFIGKGSSSFKIVRMALAASKGQADKLEKLGIILKKGKSISIKRKDGKPFVMNFDGELQKEQTEWSATIVEKKLKFVFPF